MMETCLRCGELYRTEHGARGPCACRSPVPSDDAVNAKYRMTDDWRRDEYLAAIGVPMLRHEPWCPDERCLCRHGAVAWQDPRPELVRDASRAAMGTVKRLFMAVREGLNIG